MNFFLADTGDLGIAAFWLLYLWLLSSIAASYLSERKGYGSKVGLASGLLLSAIGAIIWLVIPARRDSRWKVQGAFGGRGKTVAAARAERDAGDGS
jgi:hypothetical protein